jgi:hypothetical protein
MLLASHLTALCVAALYPTLLLLLLLHHRLEPNAFRSEGATMQARIQAMKEQNWVESDEFVKVSSMWQLLVCSTHKPCQRSHITCVLGCCQLGPSTTKTGSRFHGFA